MDSIFAAISAKYQKPTLPDVRTGDIVRVHQRIQEGGKTRTQIFEGIIISREGGNGINASIVVRKVSDGVGVEKKYLLNSPTVEKVVVLRSSKVRRKKIFFLRELTGKASRLREKKRTVSDMIIGTPAPEEVIGEDMPQAVIAEAETTPVVEETVETPVAADTTEAEAQVSAPETSAEHTNEEVA